MCGIGGFCSFAKDYTIHPEAPLRILNQMHQLQSHRGPDDHGTFLDTHTGLSHARLSIIDPAGGHQPMIHAESGRTCAIVYNGELYNTKELRRDLTLLGNTFETASDTEVILLAYLEYGADFVTRLNGIFAFAIWDSAAERLLLYRDRSGIKPLFYCLQEDELLFSSEIKALFACPDFEARIDREGFNEIFSIGPARTSGSGVFRGVREILPGHFAIYNRRGFRQHSYWKLESHPHEDSYDTTVEKTAALVLDSIQRQMVSDVPVCTFLSGGIDSSLVSDVCASELRKKGEKLSTFSFDFTGNQNNFQANSFQPSQDRPYVDLMAAFLDSDHHYLECTTADQAELLRQSVDAHDLPAMADVDSSLLFFCSQVRRTHKVALTGECADEIFGGYPWFHKDECFRADTFPWTMDLKPRQALLRDDFLEYLNMEEYVTARYEESIAQTPRLASDSPHERRRREISWLNQKWFMQTLLNRMDRTSMFSGLEARVPFADHRILEYVWNVPWEMKAKGGVAKALLRECGRDYLPNEIRLRRKSPYPKTYDSGYETLLADKIREEILGDSSAPVLSFLDRKKTEAFLKAPSDYGKPWYGQLMAGPQMMAYIWQINYWMKKFFHPPFSFSPTCRYN